MNLQYGNVRARCRDPPAILLRGKPDLHTSQARNPRIHEYRVRVWSARVLLRLNPAVGAETGSIGVGRSLTYQSEDQRAYLDLYMRHSRRENLLGERDFRRKCIHLAKNIAVL